MKKNTTKKYIGILTLSSLGALVSTQAAVILQDDFTTDSTPSNQFRAYENRIDDGWNRSRNATGFSEWNITGGRLENPDVSGANTQEGESAAWQWWSNPLLGSSTDTILSVTFDYVTDTTVGTDSIAAHFWAIQTVAPPGSGNDFLSNTANWQNGNSSQNEDVSSGGYDTFNLLDGDTTPDNGDSITGNLSGTDTFTWSIDVSTLGIAGVTSVGDIDGFFFGIGGTETGGGTSSIDNLSITSVPEPSSTALLGLGFTAFAMRRRRD